MSDDDITVVRNEETGSYGLYHPAEHTIETYIGDDREELPGEYYGKNWVDADTEALQASIEADIQDVRDGLRDLRSRDLTSEQERELERVENQLESYERAFELVIEAYPEDTQSDA